MYVGSIRRKKINLWLLLLIVLFIIAIIFTIIHIVNSSRANSDNRYNYVTSQSDKKNNAINRLINTETNGSGIGRIDSYTNFREIDEIGFDNNSINSNENTSQSQTTSEETTTTKEVKKNGYLCKMFVSNISYTNLTSNPNLKEYIQETYKLQVTSEIKSGTINGNTLSICTMAENNEVAYLIITPLNNSDVLILKVFNDKNTSAMIEDLTGILGDISELKSNI